MSRPVVADGNAPVAEADLRRVLERRAAQLARPAGQRDAAEEGELFLVFVDGGTRYALGVVHILEIFRLLELAILPGVPAPGLGLTAWRGDLLLLVQLDARAQQRTDPESNRSVVVLKTPAGPTGLVIDAVETVLRITPAEQHAAPAGMNSALVRGIAGDGTIILDGAELVKSLA